MCEGMIELLRPNRIGSRLHRCLNRQIVVNSFVVIINSDAQYFFRILLTNNVLVQILVYLLAKKKKIQIRLDVP